MKRRFAVANDQQDIMFCKASATYRKMLSASRVGGAFVITFGQEASADQDLRTGLAGIHFKSVDSLRPEEGTDILTGADPERGDDRGNDWTARWKGFIEGPFAGKVTFTAEAADRLRFEIDDSVVINGFSETGARSSGKTGFLSSFCTAQPGPEGPQAVILA